MRKLSTAGRWTAILAGAAPLVTVATCNQSPNGRSRFVVNSTNDDLAEDFLEVFFDDDDVEDFFDDLEDAFDD